MGYETDVLRPKLVRLCKQQGWEAWVMHADAFTGRGRSDVWICAKGRFVAVELKAPNGAIRPRQPDFIKAVRRAGGVAFIARHPELAVQIIWLIVERGMYMAQDTPVELVDLSFLIGDLPPTEEDDGSIPYPDPPAEAAATLVIEVEGIQVPDTTPPQVAPEPQYAQPTQQIIDPNATDRELLRYMCLLLWDIRALLQGSPDEQPEMQAEAFLQTLQPEKPKRRKKA